MISLPRGPRNPSCERHSHDRWTTSYEASRTLPDNALIVLRFTQAPDGLSVTLDRIDAGADGRLCLWVSILTDEELAEESEYNADENESP